MREVKEKMYYIVHINYSVNRAYIFSYRKTRIFTTNQAWKFVEDINNSVKIDGRIRINNRSIREIEDDIEKNYLADCNFDNTKTIFLTTNVVSDERGNDIEYYTAAEKKYEEELELLLDENAAYDYPGNINVVDVNSFDEFEQEEIINDSAAIQQEFSDENKEIITEDFVKFEEILKQNKFIDCYFEGRIQLTSEFVNECSHPSIIPLIYNFFPFAFVEHEEENCSIKVETRLGTIFILKPLDCPDIDCLEQYRKEHYYDVSLCIF